MIFLGLRNCVIFFVSREVAQFFFGGGDKACMIFFWLDRLHDQ